MKKLKVPYIKQKKDYLCSETSSSMILKYFGFDIDQEEIKCESFENMIPCINENIACKIKSKGNFKAIQKLIDKNKPIIARIVPPKQKERHTIVITGYDEKNLYIHDPSIPKPHLKINRDYFNQLWSKTDNLYMECELKIKEKKPKIKEEINNEEKNRFLELYQEELEKE